MIPAMCEKPRQRILIFLLLFLPIVLAAQEVVDQARADVEYLASPELQGRGYLHGGHVTAAAYIKERFLALGVDSFPGGYYQFFKMKVNEFPGRISLRINGTDLVPGRQFIPDAASAGGENHGDIPFINAGSGLVIPSRRINDYRGRYPAGHITILDEAIPDSVRADTTIDPGYYSTQLRIQSAMAMGARGVIVVTDRLTYGRAQEALRIPLLYVLRSAMPDAVADVSYNIVNRIRDVTTQNVAGYIRGRRYPDKFLMITAHYDHLGMIADQVCFPGANDNASGVAMMLALAKYFQEHPPEYSIAFVAFSGEEAGLLGSQYFAEHPLLDLSSVRFLLNVDMTASGTDGITAVGGKVFGEEFELLKEAAEDADVEDVRKREVAPNSDHYPIVSRGVRGFYVYPFTGYQPYHSMDDVPGTLQWDVFARLYSIFTEFLEELQE